MKLTIDPAVIEKHGLTANEFLLLMLAVHNVDIQKARTELLSKGFIISVLDLGDGVDFQKTKLGIETYNKIIMESSPIQSVNEDRLIHLAEQLKSIFPKGKKEGTALYWAEGVQLIVKRLELFFHKYDKTGKLTDEQIINATKKYVDEMLGNPSMRVLRYFIFKEPVGKGGTVEPVSDLLTYIENMDQVDESSDSAFITLF